MTEPGIASDDDRTISGLSWWTGTWRWVETLNAFLERAYHQADVDTGC